MSITRFFIPYEIANLMRKRPTNKARYTKDLVLLGNFSLPKHRSAIENLFLVFEKMEDLPVHQTSANFEDYAKYPLSQTPIWTPAIQSLPLRVFALLMYQISEFPA